QLNACRELGSSFVAFSPVARGFLSGKLRDVAALDAKDIRRGMPRFEPANYAGNLKLLPAFEAVAAEAGCTPAQLALAWLLHKDSNVIPLFGTTSLEHLAENVAAADVKLSPETMAKVERVINQRTVVGNRYSEQSNREVDTEVF
ncbi:MAG: aldo/keto reductase, partial [Methylobacterium sp.]|nr:aldo/keto reductase [Methylobacterium sp.]